MRTIDAKMAGTNISGEPRNRMFSALLHLSLEHFGSVTQLVKASCTGSAAALLRPQYEALIRGIYVQDCATEKQIEQLLSGKEFPKFAVMIKALEEKAGSTNSSLRRLYEIFKMTLHGFTHGGLEQIQRRFSGADLVNCFEEAKKLSFSSSPMCLRKWPLHLLLR